MFQENYKWYDNTTLINLYYRSLNGQYKPITEIIFVDEKKIDDILNLYEVWKVWKYTNTRKLIYWTSNLYFISSRL